MNIEELVKKFSGGFLGIDGRSAENILRAALTEQAETHAIELRAYEATVQNLRRELAAEYERKQALLLEAHCERVSSLQERIRQPEAVRVPEGWQRVTVEPTEYEIQAACKALWESESHPMLTRAGYNTNFEFLPETILLGLRKKVRAIRTAMLAAAAQPKKEGE